MSFKVEIEGIEKTITKMWKYSLEFHENTKNITKKATGVVRNQMKSDVPVGKTKNLRSSIKAKYFWKDGPASTVFPRGKKGAHRHLVRYGTDNRYHKSGKFVGKMPAQDFTSKAKAKGSLYFESAIRNEVNKNVTI